MLNNNDLEHIEPKDEDKDGIPDFAEDKLDSVPDEQKEYQESLTDGKEEKGFVKKAIDKGRKVLAGENTAGKIGGHAKDILTRFGLLPQWMNEATDEIGDSLKPKQTDKPMFSKILSVKNFINMKDENGNFSWQELGASLLQIVLAGAIVYGAIELGIWNELMQIFEQGE